MTEVANLQRLYSTATCVSTPYLSDTSLARNNSTIYMKNVESPASERTLQIHSRSANQIRNISSHITPIHLSETRSPIPDRGREMRTSEVATSWHPYGLSFNINRNSGMFCPASFKISTRSFACLPSCAVNRVMEVPCAPARAVRPIRWTYLNQVIYKRHDRDAEVLFNILRHVIVDDELNILNINSSTWHEDSNRRGNIRTTTHQIGGD